MADHMYQTTVMPQKRICTVDAKVDWLRLEWIF